MQQTQNYLKLLLFIMNRDGESLPASQACKVLTGKVGSPLSESPKPKRLSGLDSYLEDAESLKTLAAQAQ